MSDFTDQDVEAYAAELLGLTPEEDPEVTDDVDPGADAADGDGEGDQEESSPAPGTPDDGEGDPDPSSGLPSPESALDPNLIATYAEFDRILNARPDVQEFFRETLNGRPPVATPPPPPTPEPVLPQLDDDMLADPAIRALYDANRATLDALAAERTRVNQLEQFTQVRAAEEFQARARVAKAEFAKSHGLDPAAVEKIAKYADAQGYSRMINQADLMGSMTDVLDTAMWKMPEFRTEAIETAVKSRTEKNRKRQKLAGVGGGSGSTPRETSRPLTDEDRRQAMIKDVAENWFGQTQEV